MSDDILDTVKAYFANEVEPGPFLTTQEARASEERQVAEYRVWLRALVSRCEQAEAENARLREAIETVCRDLTVIEYTCDHVNYDHATATALTNLYLTAKKARREP